MNPWGWTSGHRDNGWCEFEREEYGTCVHDMALAFEALPFWTRVEKVLSAEWFFFRVEFDGRMYDR